MFYHRYNSEIALLRSMAREPRGKGVKRQNINRSPQRSSDDDGSSLSGSQSETDHSDFQRRTPLEQLLASPKRPKADPPLTVVQVFASPT